MCLMGWLMLDCHSKECWQWERQTQPIVRLVDLQSTYWSGMQSDPFSPTSEPLTANTSTSCLLLMWSVVYSRVRCAQRCHISLKAFPTVTTAVFAIGINKARINWIFNVFWSDVYQMNYVITQSTITMFRLGQEINLYIGRLPSLWDQPMSKVTFQSHN